MGQWDPLAERIPVDMRRLATQLRRMKDRAGLTVPALAARTAQSVESWELALAGRQLPPLDAVEVLAQASGADYERIGALWRLAEKAGTGTGDRGRGRPVPYPDPLDPLGPEEGLPGDHRRMLLLVTAGVLTALALIAVMLTAGTSTGRAPRQNAGPTESVPAVAGSGAQRGGAVAGAATPGGTATGGDTGSAASGGNPDTDMGGSGDQPSAVLGSAAPSAGADPVGPAASTPPATGSGSGGTSATTGGATGSGDTGSGGTASGGSGTGSGSGSGSGSTGSAGGTPSAPPASPSPTPSPTRTGGGLCLGVVLLNICIG